MIRLLVTLGISAAFVAIVFLIAKSAPLPAEGDAPEPGRSQKLRYYLSMCVVLLLSAALAFCFYLFTPYEIEGAELWFAALPEGEAA